VLRFDVGGGGGGAGGALANEDVGFLEAGGGIGGFLPTGGGGFGLDIAISGLESDG